MIAVIPARGGSRRVPGKNIRPFFGKPIIAYSIEAALETGLFQNVIVSTDSEDIARVSTQHGASVMWRAPSLAQDAVGTRHVVRDVLFNYDDGKLDSLTYIPPTGAVCCLYATAPMMRAGDIVAAYEFLKRPYVSHVISVGYPPLQDAAQFYWSRAGALRNDVEYFGTDTLLYKIPSERVCDINVPEDWDRAVQMYGRSHASV